MDEVAADVQESASAALDSVVDVGRVDIEVAEEADDGAEFSDAAFGRAVRGGGAIADSCGS